MSVPTCLQISTRSRGPRLDSGSSEEQIESWGGGIVAADLGGLAIDKVMSGEANALFQEGDVPIAPNWKPD